MARGAREREAERAALATTWEDLLARITEHLAAEEQHILPLAAAHMTPAEWRRLGEEGIGGLPRKQLPLALGMVMYQADPEVIRGMLSHAPWCRGCSCPTSPRGPTRVTPSASTGRRHRERPSLAHLRVVELVVPPARKPCMPS